MKLFHMTLILLLSLAILDAVESRRKTRSSAHVNQKNRRRKNKSGTRARKGHRKRESLTTAAEMTTETPYLLLGDILRLKSQYMEEFSRKRAALLSGQTVEAMESVKRDITNHYTEAIIDASFFYNFSNPHLQDVKIFGKFGFHSPHNNIQGTLVQVADAGIKDSHFGCEGRLANKRKVLAINGPWIALIARGKCTFLVKIKLAEKYGANAVIVYDTKPRRDVEVMRTIGTKITALMINAADGKRLAQQTNLNGSMELNITVGAIHIETSDFPESVVTNSYTEAIVDFHFNATKQETDIIEIAPHRTIGKFGRHSPRRDIFGQVVHILDIGSSDTHYGCSGGIKNHNEIEFTKGKWIALIAGGLCNDDVKIKLAEKYSASAVVIYDTDLSDTPTIMNTLGTKITALMVNMRDGKAAVELIQAGHAMYMNITVGATLLENASPGGHATTAMISPFLFLLTTLFVNFN